MTKFRWIDRAACIRRVAVLVLLIEGMTPDKAIDAAIHKKDGDIHRYCRHPEQIPPGQREKIKKDALYFLDVPARLIALGLGRRDRVEG